MTREQFVKVYRTYRFAWKNKDWDSTMQLDYTYRGLWTVYQNRPGFGFGGNIIPQSPELRSKLRKAKVARRKAKSAKALAA